MSNRRNFETLANLAVTTSHFAHGPVTMPYYGKKLKEEVRELLAEINAFNEVNLERIDDELGDVLMVLVKICKFYNSDPYDLLFKATNKAFMRIANPDWGREKKAENTANTANIPEDYPGKAYQPLFDYMSAEHGIMLMEGDIHEIINIVLSIQGNGKSIVTEFNDRGESFSGMNATGKAGVFGGEVLNIPETFQLLQKIKNGNVVYNDFPSFNELIKFGYIQIITNKAIITPKGEEAIKTFNSAQCPATAGSKILPLWYPLLKQFGSGQSENLKADSEYLSILLEMGHIAGNEAGGYYITPSGCTALDFLDKIGPDWEPLSKTGIFGSFNPSKALESFKNAMEDLIKQYPGLRAKLAEEDKIKVHFGKNNQEWFNPEDVHTQESKAAPVSDLAGQKKEAEKPLFTVSVGSPEYAILKYLEEKYPTSGQVQYDVITEILKDNHCITYGIAQDDNTVFATLTVAGICVIAEAEERSKAPEKPVKVKKPQPGGSILKRPKHDTHELNSVGQISEDGPLGRLFIMAIDKLKATCYRSYTDDEVLKILNESTAQRYK